MEFEQVLGENNLKLRRREHISTLTTCHVTRLYSSTEPIRYNGSGEIELGSMRLAWRTDR